MQLGQEEQSVSGHEDDDMLFYVRCNPKNNSHEVSTVQFSNAVNLLLPWIHSSKHHGCYGITRCCF